MNATDARYTRFALCREMMDTVGVVERFDPAQTAEAAEAIGRVGRLFLTGEGSSRIFPAKNAIRKSLTWGADLWIATEGSRQAATYDLSTFAVFGASNSGRTAEVIAVLSRLAEAGNPNVDNLALSGVEPARYTFVGLPLRLEEADSSPVRAVLLREEMPEP